MGPGRKVPVNDLSAIRGIWEVRVKKYRTRQKKEQERVEKSALCRIDQQWQYRIYCKSLKTRELNELHHYLERSSLSDRQPCTGRPDTSTDVQQDQPDDEHPDGTSLILRLEGERWLDFPRELRWTTYLREWHVRRTKIGQLPDFLALFTQLTVLEIPKNLIRDLPPEIGKLSALRKLNLSYNRLSRVPAPLGDCENLETLQLAGNLDLCELPFELSRLKRLVHLDVSENRFVSIPICALRMTGLQLLDLSNNRLTDLPQDMDRLQELTTLYVHKNKLSYLPVCLSNISTLRMVVVSADDLTCVPTKLCTEPHIKFIRLYEKASREKMKTKEEEEKRSKEKRRRTWTEQKEEEVKDGREKEFMEAYVSTLQDRDTVPFSTTKVSISCLL